MVVKKVEGSNTGVSEVVALVATIIVPLVTSSPSIGLVRVLLVPK